ncbi:MAG: SDR family oxidoreductase [Proteobacteria bacterium]|nr:SDR family oxidoreductase [Pseudomonadota bacterium]MDA0961098.1 SDR family oxidoreductase [Pseudomonadota bacterium]MDA1152876.1 SDR family oxidoreductase [Pseudomonadota bacterium]
MNGQKVLITAGASGIGHALAEAFTAAGANVWVIDVLPLSKIDFSARWRYDRVDVRDATAMQNLFDRILTEWTGLDVLCANAGISGPTALIEDQPIEAFRDCIAVNLEGAFLAVQGALPMMKQQRKGAVIFTSSTAGLYGFPYRSPYCASKWAIHGFMKTLAMEAGPYGVRANAIAPGCVDGPRMDNVLLKEAVQKGTEPQMVRRAYEAGVSMRSFVTVDDIAAMAVFLASDVAGRISGQVIAVDGHTENPDPKVGTSQ